MARILIVEDDPYRQRSGLGRLTPAALARVTEQYSKRGRRILRQQVLRKTLAPTGAAEL